MCDWEMTVICPVVQLSGFKGYSVNSHKMAHGGGHWPLHQLNWTRCQSWGLTIDIDVLVTPQPPSFQTREPVGE